uniref:uncharacterized protein LOC122588240 n=1 Tax=Erigeron canadensis TaxID=72917 RepID=UPI001CB8C109|nr:uncharacterized protein LOC122588240 [Erigeron canadensis]
MDEVIKEMMEGLAINESSSSSLYVDLEYEFDACQFFDLSVNETDSDVRKAEGWFRCIPEYPPAPYILKIKLKSTPANEVYSTNSLKTGGVEDVSPSVITPSDCGLMSSSDEKNEVFSCENLLADIQFLKGEFKSMSRSSNSSTKTFMKPTACRMAKLNNMVDTHTGSDGRSPKVQTPNGSETEDTKRQKLEIGFLRKVSQLKHQTSLSHKTKPGSKTTVPKEPKLMTEERAQWRRSHSNPETNMHTFKALPLNRKIFDSPSLPIRMKSMTRSTPEIQKFRFKYDN